jgi:hypothetical protein
MAVSYILLIAGAYNEFGDATQSPVVAGKVFDNKLVSGKNKLMMHGSEYFTLIPANWKWVDTFVNRLDTAYFDGDVEWSNDDILRALALTKHATWSFEDPETGSALMARIGGFAPYNPLPVML